MGRSGGADSGGGGNVWAGVDGGMVIKVSLHDKESIPAADDWAQVKSRVVIFHLGCSWLAVGNVTRHLRSSDTDSY